MIYSPKPFSKLLVCTKIIFRGLEISISMDDSCGTLEQLSRTNIRVYKDEMPFDDVTEKFTKDCIRTDFGTDAEDLFSIMKAIDKKMKGK